MLDAHILLRKQLIDRTDCLKDISILYLLIALRRLNKIKDPANVISLFVILRGLRRSQTFAMVRRRANLLISQGYAVKVGTRYKITEQGKQALIEIERVCKLNQYTYGQPKKPVKGLLKRPKSLL